MLQSIFIPFFTILLAELFDKSQLALLLLSTKVRHHFALLFGAMLAFIIVDGIAVLFGSFLASIVPEQYVKIAASILFFYFGIKSLRESTKGENEKPQQKGAFLAAFTAIFFSEWGDKTQLASAAFATRFEPLYVFAGVMAAMFVLAILAIYLGKYISSKVNTQTIHRVAGAIFMLLGVIFLTT